MNLLNTSQLRIPNDLTIVVLSCIFLLCSCGGDKSKNSDESTNEMNLEDIILQGVANDLEAKAIESSIFEKKRVEFNDENILVLKDSVLQTSIITYIQEVRDYYNGPYYDLYTFSVCTNTNTNIIVNGRVFSDSKLDSLFNEFKIELNRPSHPVSSVDYKSPKGDTISVPKYVMEVVWNEDFSNNNNITRYFGIVRFMKNQINSLRNELSVALFNSTFDTLSDDKKIELIDAIPMIIILHFDKSCSQIPVLDESTEKEIENLIGD